MTSQAGEMIQQMHHLFQLNEHSSLSQRYVNKPWVLVTTVFINSGTKSVIVSIFWTLKCDRICGI